MDILVRYISFRFLRPKFGTHEIRVIPGFCDVNLEVSESDPRSGIGRLDKVYGGAISELIASRFSNEVNGLSSTLLISTGESTNPQARRFL